MQMLSKAICWHKGKLLSCPICSRPKKWSHSLWENERVYNLYGVGNIETVSFLLSHQFLHEHSPWKGEGFQCHASWLVFDARRYSGRVIATNGSTCHRFWTQIRLAFWLCHPWIAIIWRKAIWRICLNCHQLVWISEAPRISFLIFWPISIWLGEWTCFTNLVRIFVGERVSFPEETMQKLHFAGRICQPVHIGVALEVGGWWHRIFFENWIGENLWPLRSDDSVAWKYRWTLPTCDLKRHGKVLNHPFFVAL